MYTVLLIHIWAQGIPHYNIFGFSLNKSCDKWIIPFLQVQKH